MGELCENFQSGKSIKSQDITNEGVYPVFGGNGLRGFTHKYNYDGEYTLIGRQGALCGNVTLVKGKSYFTEHAVVVSANHDNITKFLYYLLEKMKLGQYSDQSAQPGLSVNKLAKLKTSTPSINEQQVISQILYTLDAFITLHQCQL